MKLAIGTVQFGVRYGINNKFGIPNLAEISAVLEAAERHEISVIDTAAAYGDSETKLGQVTSEKFKIVTKYSDVPKNGLENELRSSLQRLRRSSVYGYLAHNANALIDNPAIWEEVQKMKSFGLVEKVGYSLYMPDQLEKLLGQGIVPDLVQIPFSIFDRKFEPYLKDLKDRGTEIHARSVFLQGLYLMDPYQLPAKLMPFKEPLLELREISSRHNFSIASIALNFAILDPLIDKIVIGIENVVQIEENIELVRNWSGSNEIFNTIKSINIDKPDLLNPANWNLDNT